MTEKSVQTQRQLFGSDIVLCVLSVLSVFSVLTIARPS